MTTRIAVISVTIPVIDISQFSTCAGSEEITDLFDKSFSEFGLVFLVGHNVSNTLFDELQSQVDDFFKRSKSEKMLQNHGYYGHPNGGYIPQGVESVARSSVGVNVAEPDLVESFSFTRYPSNYKLPLLLSELVDLGSEYIEPQLISPFSSAEIYFHEMERILDTVHSIAACSLGLDQNFFRPFFDNSHGSSGNAIRFAHYPAMPSERLEINIDGVTLNSKENSSSNAQRYGAHTDYQGFTILKADENDWVVDGAGGLEVLVPGTDTWFPVNTKVLKSNEKVFVINAGDLIQLWTNDR